MNDAAADAATRVVSAIAGRDFQRLRTALDAEVRFRFATPNKVQELTGPEAVASQLQVWFGQGEVELLDQGTAPARPAVRAAGTVSASGRSR